MKIKKFNDINKIEENFRHSENQEFIDELFDVSQILNFFINYNEEGLLDGIRLKEGISLDLVNEHLHEDLYKFRFEKPNDIYIKGMEMLDMVEKFGLKYKKIFN